MKTRHHLQVLCICNDPSYVIGYSLVFIKICRILSKRGHKVLLITRAGGAVERILGDSANERRIKAPAGSSKISGLIFAIKAFVIGLREAPGFNIILVPASFESFLGLLIGKLSGLRTVEYHYDVYPLNEWLSTQKTFLRKIFVGIIMVMNYYCLRFFDAVLSLSPYTTKLLREEGWYNGFIRTVGTPIDEV